MNNNRNTGWIIVAIIIIAGILYFAFKPAATVPVDTGSNGSQVDNNGSTGQNNGDNGQIGQTPGQTDANGNAVDMIKVTSPKEGDTVDASNGFSVTGQARGGWFFEASAPLYVYDNN